MKPTPNMEIKREVAKRIKYIRQTIAELSQKDFAADLRISRTHANRIESLDYEVMPSNPLLKKICRQYRVNFLWLSEGRGPINDDTTGPLDLKKAPKNTQLYANLIEVPIKELLRNKGLSPEAFNDYMENFVLLINPFMTLMSESRDYYEKGSKVPPAIYRDYLDTLQKIIDDLPSEKS